MHSTAKPSITFAQTDGADAEVIDEVIIIGRRVVDSSLATQLSVSSDFDYSYLTMVRSPIFWNKPRVFRSTGKAVSSKPTAYAATAAVVFELKSMASQS